MKKLFLICVFLFLNTNYSFSTTTGSGEVKFSNLVLDGVLHYFDINAVRNKSGNVTGVPSHFAVSKSGRDYGYTYCPSGQSCVNEPIQALQLCRKRSGERCYIFARGRKIVWNQINYKVSRKASRSEIRSLLEDYGFHGNKAKETKPKITKKKETSKKKVDDDNIVKKLKELNELYKSGVLSKEEFDKAKKKILN